jgi:hypothetical protein
MEEEIKRYQIYQTQLIVKRKDQYMTRQLFCSVAGSRTASGPQKIFYRSQNFYKQRPFLS